MLGDGTMKIYTRTGDQGQTSLLSGQRVRKSDLRVETYGMLDELNSWIGYARSLNADPEVEAALSHLQPLIHVLCSDIAAPTDVPGSEFSGPRINSGEDAMLEREIDLMTADLSHLTNFILPGGTPPAAILHLARTVCRRTERRLVELNFAEGSVNPHALRFLNRLSDYLFTLARWVNWRSGIKETLWITGDDE